MECRMMKTIMCLLLLGVLLPASAAPLLCAMPGKDMAAAQAAGVINTYWPAAAAGLVAGQTEIPLGPPRGDGLLTAGDLLLVIAMQGADISARNDSRYGDGYGHGQGLLQFTAGRFELVRVQRADADRVVVSGAGPGAGLRFSYPVREPATNRDQGRATWQLVRVPQYRNLSLTDSLHALPWNGSTGGVLALDVSGTLLLSGHKLDASATGFRGGAALPLKGALGAIDDYRYPAPTAENLVNRYGSHGSKGEGIAGTPRWVMADRVRVETSADTGRNASDGYPDGSMGRGAPANAGGGGNSLSFDNRRASGGGGGAGGQAGMPGQDASTQPAGGLGGVPINQAALLLVPGGGGGGSALGGMPAWQGSGGAGGGVLLITAGRMEGVGALDVSGGAGLDGPAGGGGGGGGMVLAWLQHLSKVSPLLNLSGGDGGKGPQGQGGDGGSGRLFLVGNTQLEGVDPRQLQSKDWPGVMPGFLCRPEGRSLSGKVLETTGSDMADSARGVAGWQWQLVQEGRTLVSGVTNAQGQLDPDLGAAARDQPLELHIAVPAGWRVVSASNDPLSGLAYLGKGRWQLASGQDDAFREVSLSVLKEPDFMAPEPRVVQANSTQIFLFRYVSHARARVSFVARTETGGQSLHFKPLLFVDPHCDGRSRYAADGQSSVFDVQPEQAFCVRLRMDVGRVSGVTMGWRLAAMTRFNEGGAPLVQTHEGRYEIQPKASTSP